MIGKVNSAVLRAAYRFNDRISRSPLGGWAVWRAAKAAGRRALEAFRGAAANGNGILLEIEGSVMRVPPRYAEWYARHGCEAFTLERFRRALRPGGTAVDVGAHLGSFTLAAARAVGPSGRVFAFEPGPENFAALTESAALNGYQNVVARRAAVGARTETRAFNFADSSDSHSFYAHPAAKIASSAPIECVALDDVLAGLKIDAVKIDVEGAEPEVIAGLEKTLAANPGIVLIVEFNSRCLRLGGHEPAAFLRRLESLGFSMTLLDETTETERAISSAQPLPSDDELFHANLYCVRKGGK